MTIEAAPSAYVAAAAGMTAVALAAGLAVAQQRRAGARKESHPPHIEATMSTLVYDAYLSSLPDGAIRGKTVAITGCTSGVGYFAALAVARMGAKCVFMLNRPSERADAAAVAVASKAAAGCEVVDVPCDLSDFSSVTQAAATVASKSKALGGLDALACNAGVMMMPDAVTKDGYDVGIQTNHHAHVLLIAKLLPALALARGGGRVCTTGSMCNYIGMPPTGSKLLGDLDAKYFAKAGAAGDISGNSFAACEERYHQTKLGQTAFALALADRLKARRSPIKAVAYDPGWSETNLPANTLNAHTAFGTHTATSVPLVGRVGVPWRVLIPAMLKMGPPGLPGGPCHGAADASASLLEALFGPHVLSGDFVGPAHPSVMSGQRNAYGPPITIMREGRGVKGAGHDHSHVLLERQANRDVVWEAAGRMLRDAVGKADIFRCGL